MLSQTTKKLPERENKVYKSLYEVREKYLPNTSLEYLESNDDLSREAFMQMLQKITHPSKERTDQEKKGISE